MAVTSGKNVSENLLDGGRNVLRVHLNVELDAPARLENVLDLEDRLVPEVGRRSAARRRRLAFDRLRRATRQIGRRIGYHRLLIVVDHLLLDISTELFEEIFGEGRF